ncbi:hypothetical protein BH10PSE7_BH10PSE7_43870 [soil metagenome]
MRRRTILLHALRIVLAYLAAALAAGLLISFSFYGITPTGFETTGEHVLLSLKTGLADFAPLVALYAAPLAIGLILIAEYIGTRNPLSYCVAAAVAGAGMSIALLPGVSDMAIIIYAVTGALCGLVYWSIAGRHAGLRRARAL